jgi:hypothetical protein
MSTLSSLADQMILLLALLAELAAIGIADAGDVAGEYRYAHLHYQPFSLHSLPCERPHIQEGALGRAGSSGSQRPTPSTHTQDPSLCLAHRSAGLNDNAGCTT